MRLTALLILLFKINTTIGQNLLPNGSFENMSDFWANFDQKILVDSCNGRQFRPQYFQNIYQLRPKNNTTKVWNFPYSFIGCKDTNRLIYETAYHGQNCLALMSYGANYFAMDLDAPLKKGLTYSVSYFVSSGPVLYKPVGGIRQPINYSNPMGFMLSSALEEAPSQFYSYKTKSKTYQMPKMTTTIGWQRMEQTFRADSSNFKYITFGFFDSNYVVTNIQIFKDADYAKNIIKEGYNYFIDSIILRPVGIKKPEISGAPLRICQGQKIKIHNKTLENIGWFVNGKTVLVDSILEFKVTENSKIIGWNSEGADTIEITVDSIAAPPIVTQDTLWCYNSVNLTASGGIYSSLKWLPGNQTTTQITVTDTLPKYIELTRGFCKDTIKISIAHLCAPQLPADTTVCLNASITIHNKYDEIAIWSVNGEAKGSAKSITLNNVQSPLLVKAENTIGYDEMGIQIKEDCFDNFKYFVPNVFTPNGAQPNEYFGPICNGQANWQLQVFDMWGQKVFDSGKNSTSYWNGTSYSSGLYAYKLSITHNYLGTEYIENTTGVLLLIR